MTPRCDVRVDLRSLAEVVDSHLPSIGAAEKTADVAPLQKSRGMGVPGKPPA